MQRNCYTGHIFRGSSDKPRFLLTWFSNFCVLFCFLMRPQSSKTSVQYRSPPPAGAGTGSKWELCQRESGFCLEIHGEFAQCDSAFRLHAVAKVVGTYVTPPFVSVWVEICLKRLTCQPTTNFTHQPHHQQPHRQQPHHHQPHPQQLLF